MRSGKKLKLNDRNIYLTGFMGCGKSTIGASLAGTMGLAFYDTDRLIEERCFSSISHIFDTKGEDYFRTAESELLSEAAKMHRAVIALGGGSTISDANRRILSGSGVTVYLRWQIEVLIHRLLNDDSRPLTSNNDGSSLAELFRLREPIYDQADIIIDCRDEASVTEITSQIVEQIEC